MTANQFSLFRGEFQKWQMLLQVGEYTVSFKQGDLKDTWAQIEVDAAGCVASCTVARKGKWTTRQIKTAAKHECVHLMLARFDEMARSRFTTAAELDAENERITCNLERALGWLS